MSEKSVAEKLQIKEGHRLMIVNSPKGYKATLLRNMPKNITVLKDGKGPADMIQVFVKSKKELGEQLVKLKPLLDSKGSIWVTYPKGTSKIKADINRDSIREHAQPVGLEAVAIFSVDSDWSALRLIQAQTSNRNL